jgi:hypothetical protein
LRENNFGFCDAAVTDENLLLRLHIEFACCDLAHHENLTRHRIAAARLISNPV